MSVFLHLKILSKVTMPLPPLHADFLTRWAAKEAVIKSIPRKVYMRDIEIYTRPSGSPFAVVLDRRDVDIDGVLERWAAEDGEPEAERAQREKQEASARQSERDRTKGEDLESETLTQTKPRYPPGGHGLRGEPEDLEVDGQYVDLSITHDGDYCVAVAVARSEK